MTSPQDDGPAPAPWVSPSARPPQGGTPGADPAGTQAGHAPSPGAAGTGDVPPGPVAPGSPAVPPAAAPVPPGSGWGTPAVPPGWGAPAAAPAAPYASGPQGPGPYGSGPHASGPWRPAPLQPGIVPLRPLGLGEILDGSVRAVRANPTVMFGLAALVVTVAVALQTLLQLYVAGLLAGAIGDALIGIDGTTDAAAVSEMFSVSLAGTASGPLLVPVSSVLTGLLIVSVSRSVLGRRVTMREVMRSRRVWWVLGFTLLVLVAQVLVGAVWIGLAVLLLAQEQEGAALAVVLVGALLALAALLWLTVRTLLVPPALMLEGKPFWATVARAWRLTRGSFWRLLGIYVLSSFLVGVIASLFAVPASLLGGVVLGLTGSTAGTIVLTAVGTIIGMTVSTSFLAAVVALLYVDVRMRREGLDLELARAASEP